MSGRLTFENLDEYQQFGKETNCLFDRIIAVPKKIGTSFQKFWDFVSEFWDFVPKILGLRSRNFGTWDFVPKNTWDFVPEILGLYPRNVGTGHENFLGEMKMIPPKNTHQQCVREQGSEHILRNQ